MGALNPLFLLAGVALAVPLFLHLFQRQEARRISFPALRYLERTEREHARRIRSRQLLLLLLRLAAMAVLVAAGARLFLRLDGSDHPPTALVLILDNSMSSGLVTGEERALDRLKEVALLSLAAATADDRIWVIRAGEPWLPAVPGGPEDARAAVEATGVSAGRGDLTAALSRAAELVTTSPLAAREIHLVSDLQASAFASAPTTPAGDVPVVVWSPGADPVPNRSLAGVLVGGGLPPLEGQRSEIALEAGPAAAGDTAGVPVRVVLGERVRGAGILPPATSLVLPLPPAPPGWVTGYADADPDALRADDRRYFAFQARPAPAVAVLGDPGIFVTEALAVLEAGGRLRRASSPRAADAVVSAAGEGLATLGAGAAALVVPPSDPNLLPALNRRLQEAGVPWRVERAEAQGEAELAGTPLPTPLAGVVVRRAYRLVLSGDPPAPPHTVAVAAGEPWAVEGRDASGRRHLLLASALDAESTSLPVSADMIGFADWLTGSWAATGGGTPSRLAGEPLSAPRGAQAVRLPSGAELPLDGTRMVRATGEAGLYAFLADDSVLAYEAVNAHPDESDLTALDEELLAARVGPAVTTVGRASAWESALFRARRGPELWRPLVVAALLILLLEAAVAAAGRRPRVSHERPAPGTVRVEA
ncbi:MAG: hypothetical protein AMXMBFR53_11270 [Gemmatimonadota bacterium]